VGFGLSMVDECRCLWGSTILYSELFKSVTANPRYKHARVVQIALENDRRQPEMVGFELDLYKWHPIHQRYL
jgi:hypothetical protein